MSSLLWHDANPDGDPSMDAYQRVVLGDMLFLAQRAFPSQDLEILEREVRDKAEREQLFLAENESQIIDELLLLARAAFPGLSPQRIAPAVQGKIETYRALRGVADPAPTTTIADFMPPSFPAGLVAMFYEHLPRRFSRGLTTEEVERHVMEARLDWWAEWWR